jgi:uncharacterized protein YcfJ
VLNPTKGNFDLTPAFTTWELIRNQEIAMFKSTIIAAGAFAMLATMQVAPSQAASRAYCEDYATQVAYRSGGRTGDVLAGTAGGAIAGGAAGAIFGKGKGKNIGKGALIGGVAGTFLGAANQRDGYIDRRAYDRAYRDCRNEGTRVQYRPSRNRYSDDVQYCMDRYRSYNPDTGQYLTNSGRYRDCP